MPDPRFFRREKPRALGDLAASVKATLAPGADPQMMIEDVAPLDQAGPRAISFLDNVRYKDQFAATKAAACIIAPAMAKHAPAGVALVLTGFPLQDLRPDRAGFLP